MNILVQVLIVVGAVVGWSAQTAEASITMEELTVLMDSARAVEAPVFAPKTYKKAFENHRDAEMSINRNNRQSIIDKYIDKAKEYTESALKATEVAKLTLVDYLPPRDRARKVRAHEVVPELYQKAEEEFTKAAEKVESGDVKGGLKQAEKSVALFDEAELEAIRVDVVGGADALIAEAREDEAEKYALSTLDKARTARDRADSILTYDRYNRDEAIKQAKLAQYEARHATNIAQIVRSLKRNDQAWEKLMLVYEIEMNRIGESLGWPNLPLDRGPTAAADTAIAAIARLQADNEHLRDERAMLTGRLQEALVQSGVEVSSDDPAGVVDAVEKRLVALKDASDSLSQSVSSQKEKLSELTQTHEQVSAELALREERESKLRMAKAIINPSEGQVLFNAANDIVLRLSGLSFDVGKSDIKDEHVPLLEKVDEIIGMFPEARLIIEGHTDAEGNESTNQTLSEKRALAVMQYIRQKRDLSPDKISSVGYGSDRPIASNKTKEGRAKNRRIDIVIMQ